ncbi:MAG: amidophosphoribosyltransferase [Clostridiales Family XIII bacterium]|jgi:amidophosphoribosyltransferase|nr:amidophosphoribosyltransferase [Clostridiales Family XIII bacterium]
MTNNSDHLHEECGVFGIASPLGTASDAAFDTFFGLFALQHRGQEAAGIAVNHGGVISCRKDLGLVMDVFDEEQLSGMPGSSAIGHVRYSTTGSGNVENAQPIAVGHIKGNLAVAHNGNLVNAGSLRRDIELGGGIFHGTSDSEIIAYTIVRERLGTESIEEAVKNTMQKIRGAYSLLAMSPRKLVAARDPNGFRPLSIGKRGNAWIFASETCAIDAVGGAFVRDVEPGEIVLVENGSLTSFDSGLTRQPSFCSFEFIYFARPDSIIGGAGVEKARREMGRALARTNRVEGDNVVVVAVPDSGRSAATGYSEESGLPNVNGLIKNRYIGRTFITPSQGQRERAVRLKLNPLAKNVEGKRIVLIDDSIVRGTTSARIVSALREAGAMEVHMRVSAPPFRHPCYFGTDVPDRDKLIAAKRSEEEVAQILGCDSLAYLPTETLGRILTDMGCPPCMACFSGDYPIELPEEPETSVFSQPIINLLGK